jgi:hypothetical protein
MASWRFGKLWTEALWLAGEAEGSRQKAESRRQESEVRRVKAEGRRRESEVRRVKAEGRRRESEG